MDNTGIPGCFVTKELHELAVRVGYMDIEKLPAFIGKRRNQGNISRQHEPTLKSVIDWLESHWYIKLGVEARVSAEDNEITYSSFIVNPNHREVEPLVYHHGNLTPKDAYMNIAKFTIRRILEL